MAGARDVSTLIQVRLESAGTFRVRQCRIHNDTKIYGSQHGMMEEDDRLDHSEGEGQPNSTDSEDKAADSGTATLGQRVRAVLNHYPNRAEAARIAGRSKDQLQLYVKGRTEPTLEVMARLCHRVGISLDWLATGEGDMRIFRSRDAATQSSEDFAFAHLPNGYMLRADTQEPVYSNLIVDSLAFRADYLQRMLGREPTDLFLLRIDGDAMEPTLRAGDLCLVDAQKTRVTASGLYALLIDGVPHVRRIDLGENGIHIIADNTHYPPQYISSNLHGSVKIIGKIICVISTINYFS
jgi:phage repressor protein C with HTH and peptisase S24 domain